MKARVHPTSIVADQASIGDDTQVWVGCQIRENVRIGSECILGRNVYVDPGVTIGSRVKIQNNVSVFTGVTIEDGVFVGPHVCFTNDMFPRAVNPDGTLKSAEDWNVTDTRVKRGAAIGANSTIRCGVTIGEWALIACGSVVTRDVPNHALMRGNPARLVGYACSCGEPIAEEAFDDSSIHTCTCGRELVKEANAVRMGSA